MALRHFVAEPLRVDANLVGQTLAPPGRRILAMLIDAIVLVVPTLVAGAAAAALSLWLTDRGSFETVRHVGRLSSHDQVAARAEAREMARLLVRLEAPGVPPAMALAVEEGDFDRAAAFLLERNVRFTIQFDEGKEAEPPAGTIRFPVERLIPAPIRAIALLGTPALYFAAFSRTRRRATPGKRLVGIHIARLDGERLSWLEALERFVGYIHIPATAFVSLLDLWRDPNRRLPHDRTVHTAVLLGPSPTWPRHLPGPPPEPPGTFDSTPS
jgi:uncharacterized RDD family membrane protein YckC